jgi:hypothetical protein
MTQADITAAEDDQETLESGSPQQRQKLRPGFSWRFSWKKNRMGKKES